MTENPSDESQYQSTDQKEAESDHIPANSASAPIGDDLEKMRPHQDLFYALIGGFFAAIISAILWAIITVTTEYQIGFMAIGVGLVVGVAVRFFGAGVDKIYGVIGAVFSLVGCLLGNLFSQVGFLAQMQQLSYLDALLLFDLDTILLILEDTFSPMDLIFYAIAVGEGYKFAFRQVPEDINSLEDAAPENSKLRLPLAIGAFVLISASFYVLSQGQNGKQALYYDDGNPYSEGEMKNGEEEGEWKYYYENGNLYLVGSFTNGIENGLWTWYYESKELMRTATYKNGLYDGAVVQYAAEGHIIDSVVHKEGRKHGLYKAYYSDGGISQVGEYARDRENGEWKSFFPDGTLSMSINFKDGEQVGATKLMYANGRLNQEFEFTEPDVGLLVNAWDPNGNQSVKDGSGKFTSFYENGEVFEEGMVKEGKRVGVWNYFYEDGKKRETGHYLDDTYYLDEAWSRKGILMVEKGNGRYELESPDDFNLLIESVNYEGGLKQGLWSTYYGSALTQVDQEMKNGKRNGPYTYYLETGIIQVEGSFDNDKQTGEWKWYYESGALNNTVSFIGGKKEGTQQFFSEMGGLVKEEVYKDGDLVSENLIF